MAPATRRRTKPSRAPRQPLTTTTTVSPEQTQILPNLTEIFNNSQQVHTSDAALNQLKKLYKNTDYNQFEEPFKNLVKKLFQSKQTIYFKTSCDFLCKFLQHVSSLSDLLKTKENDASENAIPATKVTKQTTKSGASNENRSKAVSKRTRQGVTKKNARRKTNDSEEDELVTSFLPPPETHYDSTSEEDSLIMDSTLCKRGRTSVASTHNRTMITNHDKLISCIIDVADLYMQVADEDCRHNAVFFVCKFLTHVESLDEEICNALKSTLPKRIRDRKPLIRAQAVLASRTFQDNPMTQEGFKHHFYRDPELVVRKALLQIMDTKVFGYDFLVDSTRDTHEVMRKAAFQRLAKIKPTELSSQQLHNVLHNGLIERERQANYTFRTLTLETWLLCWYDGIDLYSLLDSFDVVSHYEDICRLLDLVFKNDLDKLENNGTITRLHHVVEAFRDRWLNGGKSNLPTVTQIDEKLVVIWLSAIKFCRNNQALIKPVKIRLVSQNNDPNESIEKILDSQERNDDVAELYERLSPDLVNLVDFLKQFVHYSDAAIRNKEADCIKLEFIYQLLMKFILTYEVGDELERKTVQEVLGVILKENLLTGQFTNFVPPIIKCLFNLIYSSSSSLMINYISELINNVRSHLEDLITSTQQNIPQPIFVSPCKTPRAIKKVKIDDNPVRNSYLPEQDSQTIEWKIATIRVELQELNDNLDACIKVKDFDQAKAINNKISDLNAELALLHGRRCSLASDVSHMSMVIDTEPVGNNKFSSTMIGDASMDESQSSTVIEKDDIRVFKHHTNELIKCLQMYLGCLQSVRISGTIPQTMLNHLNNLTCESLDEWFKGDCRVRSLMIACNGITALVDEEFAKQPTTMTLLIAACFDPSLEIKTIGFKSLVDAICQNEELEFPYTKLEKFLCSNLRDYGKYNPVGIKKEELDLITALVEGTSKLFFFRKIDSPEILSHMIIWWYHPRTQSKLKQFIGIFLPTFVDEISRKQQGPEDTWLADLLTETFVTSIEYLHDYILGPGFNIMAAGDMLSLINFLSNLVPAQHHNGIQDRLDQRIDDISESSPDLMKYLKLAKNSLNSVLVRVAPIE